MWRLSYRDRNALAPASRLRPLWVESGRWAHKIAASHLAVANLTRAAARGFYGCSVRSNIETSYPMFRTRWIKPSTMRFGGLGSRERIQR